jgi:hypothetical protein
MSRVETIDRTEVADVERFEAQMAETAGEMKALFNEFRQQLGAMVNQARIASSEAREEGVRVRAALEELARQAKATAEAQRRALAELRDGWRLHVAENSKGAGEDIARAFGAQIASGLQQKLQGLGTAVERATQRFGWITALKWTGGVAIGIVLTVLLILWAFLPRVEGLPWHYVRAAATELRLCYVEKAAHVCIATDDKPRVLKDANGEAMVVARGL